MGPHLRRAKREAIIQGGCVAVPREITAAAGLTVQVNVALCIIRWVGSWNGWRAATASGVGVARMWVGVKF